MAKVGSLGAKLSVGSKASSRQEAATRADIATGMAPRSRAAAAAPASGAAQEPAVKNERRNADVPKRTASAAKPRSQPEPDEDEEDVFYDATAPDAPGKRAPVTSSRNGVPKAEAAAAAAAKPSQGAGGVPAADSRGEPGSDVALGRTTSLSDAHSIRSHGEIVPEHAKERSARIAKLSTKDVMQTTEEMRSDLRDAHEILHLFLNSHMLEAQERVDPYADKKLYYAVAYALLATIKALMTFEHQDLAAAFSNCRDTLRIASLLRKPSSAFSTISRFVRGAGPSVTWMASMTPLQRHAELVYAECLLLKAVIGIAHSGDILGFLSEALHLRQAYGMYRSLNKFVEWEIQTGEPEDADFRSGVYLGNGMISLILGLLPSKVLKIMEVFGYEGDVHEGLRILSKAGQWSDNPKVTAPGLGIKEEGIRRALCDMAMLVYHLVVSTFVPVPGVDIPFAEKVLNYHLARYPRGVFFLYFDGRLHSTQALPQRAIKNLRAARDVQNDYVQLKHICYWDMALCTMALETWQDTYRYFSVLAEENNWSKAVYNYARAAALYQMGDVDRAAEICARVPKLTQKIAGKSIPLEKFVARKANKMNEQHKLLLPAMEFSYITHCFSTAPRWVLYERALPTIEETLEHAQSVDDLCLAHFLRGVVLRNMAFPEKVNKLDPPQCPIPVEEAARKAEQSLRLVADRGHEIVYDHYLLYFSHYELGRLYINMKRIPEARKELDLVLSGKNLGDHGRKGKYSMQNMAVLRSNGAMELLQKPQEL